MRPLSAVDAIDPALRHTWRLLVARRDFRTFFKVAAVAFFAEIGGCNASYHSGGGHLPALPPAIAAGIATLAILFAVIATAIALAFFYVSSRLQLTILDIVLRSDTAVAPIWRRFGAITWRWIGLKLLFFLAFLLACSPILIPFVLQFVRHMPKNGQINPDHVGAFFAVFFAAFAGLFLLLIVFSTCNILLRDFGLPSMALENAPLGVTVRRILALLRAEPGQVLLYLLMRFLMGIAGAIVSYMVIGLGALIALIPLGGAAFIFWAALRHSGAGGHLAMICGWTVCGIVFAALFFIAAIYFFGFLFAFFQAYALFFLGGRYPRIGVFLDASLPQPTPSYGYPAPPAGYSAYTPPLPESAPPPSSMDIDLTE